MRARLRSRDEGASTLELGLVLPVVMLIVTITIPVVQAGWSYLVLSRATSAGIRYATRTDENARTAGGTLVRRPSGAEVAAFVRDAASPLTPSDVTVTPEPVATMPGETVTVRVAYQISFGPLAAAANGMSSVLGGGRILPDSKVVTVSARGREE